MFCKDYGGEHLIWTWKISGLHSCWVAVYECLWGWRHHGDAACITESKDLCFEDGSSKDLL